MARRGENIYKRKDGRWEGRYIKAYSPEHKAKYGYIYGKTYTETKKKLITAKAGIHPVTHWEQRKQLTYFSEGLSLWLQSKKESVKEATFARYNHLIETHIRPELGNCLLIDITAARVECYTQFLLLKGRVDGTGGLSPKTVSEILAVVKAAISYLRIFGISIDERILRLTVRKKETDIRVLTVEEQKKLESVLLADVNLPKFGVLLSLYTGIRLGELCALQWKDIDLENGKISISKTMQRIQNVDGVGVSRTKVIITTPKTSNSVRIIPIPVFIIQLARPLSGSPEAFILTDSEKKYIEPRSMQNFFKQLLRACDVSDMNFHALRHTFATRCIELNFEVKSLSEILGHATVNITLNRYVHSSFLLKQKNMQLLEPLITK